MATTRTATTTRTLARIEFLAINVATMLDAVLGPQEKDLIERLARGVREKLLHSIDIFGIDRRGQTQAQLRITIDWQQHRVLVNAGYGQVRTDRHDATAPEAVQSAVGFKRVLTDKNLEAETEWKYAPGVDRNEGRKLLGGSSIKPGNSRESKWPAGSEPMRRGCRLQDAEEMGIEVTLAAEADTSETRPTNDVPKLDPPTMERLRKLLAEVKMIE